MEVDMGIEKRWEPSSPEYVEALKYLSTRVYQRALEELQRLVIQRLFELHKMNISATGESHLIFELLVEELMLFRLSYADPHCKGSAELL
jgi:hypothetical protein